MTWLPFYREVAQVLSTYENRQGELLKLLREMQSAELKTISLNDVGEGDETIPLREIDPFSFLATFHRTGDEMRLALWNFLRDKWNLSEAVPQNLGGLPTVMANAAWFIPFEKDRKEEDVAALWGIFQAAHAGVPISQESWQRALQVSGVGVAKLTSGLFWTNAEKYLSLDSVMLKYLARYGIKPDISSVNSSVAEYQRVLGQIHDALGYDHIHLSREAWETRDAVAGSMRYWAGGHDWSTGSQLERFLQNHEWQLGYTDEHDTPNARSLIELFREIQIGDEFAIKGSSPQKLKVYYVGRVREIDLQNRTLKLDPLPNRPLHDGPKPAGKGSGNWMLSLLEVKRPEDIQLIFHGAPPPPPPPSKFSLNHILYGPPGTGKTFSSVARAVEIIDGVISDDRPETVARFAELRAAGRIGFVTFHQSFAYEEFVEGLRPVLDDAANGTARYEISDGVFKRMALKALAATLVHPAHPTEGKPTFEVLWDEFLSRIKEDAIYEIPGLSGSKYRLEVTPRGNILGENIGGAAQRPYNTSRGKVREVWEKLGTNEKPTHKRLFAILERGAHTNLIGAVIEELRRIAAQGGAELTTISQNRDQSVTVEDANDWLENNSDLETIAGEPPRFVLIIDEINRGNIAKIFGELITLLETDKRLSATNELRVLLPYSKETFGVPRNLYLLGTMNTADKSLSLLDIALRRRFEFEELRPNFAVCEKLDDTMRKVLSALNQRLMRVLDREHRLGQAPWMGVQTSAEWNAVFLKQIVPLLQEYFYNDWDNLRAVLGETGKGAIVRELPSLDGLNSRTRYAWWFDVDDDASPPDFLAVLARNFKLTEAPLAAPEPDAAADDSGTNDE